MDFHPGRGSEQKGVRPAVIIQNDLGNRYAATTIVAAITSAIKIYPVTVPLKKGEAGLDRTSMVNLAQILTVDKGRLKKRLGRISDKKMQLVDRAIQVSVSIGVQAAT